MGFNACGYVVIRDNEGEWIDADTFKRNLQNTKKQADVDEALMGPAWTAANKRKRYALVQLTIIRTAEDC